MQLKISNKIFILDYCRRVEYFFYKILQYIVKTKFLIIIIIINRHNVYNKYFLYVYLSCHCNGLDICNIKCVCCDGIGKTGDGLRRVRRIYGPKFLRSPLILPRGLWRTFDAEREEKPVVGLEFVFYFIFFFFLIPSRALGPHDTPYNTKGNRYYYYYLLLL